MRQFLGHFGVLLRLTQNSGDLHAMTPEEILPTYERVGIEWARTRGVSLFERPWLDKMLSLAPGKSVLDLGCGSGQPIARYLTERKCQMTGVDGAKVMVRLYAQTLPEAEVHFHDMRTLTLGKTFDAILAWNSFFHLSAHDQQTMFEVFKRHAAPGAALMFTSGPKAAEAIGEVAGEKVYHSSLDPSDYRHLLRRHGFVEKAFVPEDPNCNGHTVWLAKYNLSTSA